MSVIRVLFVCLGNICRSPMAEGVFRDKVNKAGLGETIEIDSAGTGAWHIGSPPDKRAQMTTQLNDIDISQQKARQVVKEDFEDFDYILAMDYTNYETLLSKADHHHSNKIQLFLNYSSGKKTIEVPDPYYGGDNNFSHVLNLIDSASQGLLNELQLRLKGSTEDS